MKRYTEAQLMALLSSVVFLQVYMMNAPEYVSVHELLVWAMGMFALAVIVVAEYEFGKALYKEFIA